jgi:predicted RNase H-like nuclease
VTQTHFGALGTMNDELKHRMIATDVAARNTTSVVENDDDGDTVCGVDGCSKGWVAAIQGPGKHQLQVRVFPTLRYLINEESPAIVAVDIPIGLPSVAARDCDVEARKLLGSPRQAGVFPAPLRPLLDAPNYAEASHRRMEIERKGLTMQAWAIFGKVREADELVQNCPSGTCIHEVHPEVSFYFLAGKQPMKYSKRSEVGYQERFQLLAAQFGDQVSRLLAKQHPGSGRDDVLDALVALWTAQRIRAGEAARIPAALERDSLGIPMQILA